MAINGTNGNDTINGNDTTVDEVIQAKGGDDVVFGFDGNDLIKGAEGNDNLSGEDGNDTIEAGTGNDTADGGDGEDLIKGGDGDDDISGGDGNDSIEAGNGNDTADGGSGDDTIKGGDGDDNISGGSGNDSIITGAGIDTVSFSGSVTGFSISQSGNDFIVQDIDPSDGDEGTDTIAPSVEFIQFGDYLLDLTGNNNDPVALIGGLTTNEDTAFTFGVNVLDFDGDVIMIDSISVTGGGSLTLLSGPTPGVTGLGSSTLFDFSFDPLDYYQYLGLGESFTETLTITTSDGNGGTKTQAFDLEITGLNDDPVAVDDNKSTDEDNSVTINVLSNDSDVDANDILTIQSTTNPTNGTVVINPNNTITYTPNPDFFGNDSFDYTVSDGKGGTDTATVTVIVNPVNDAPVSLDQPVVADEENGPFIINLADQVNDVDGDPLTFTNIRITSGQTPVPFVVIGNGVISIDPADAGLGEGDILNTSISFKVSDGELSDTGIVPLTINGADDAPPPPNSPPVASPLSVTADEEDGLVMLSLPTFVSDPDVGDVLTITTLTVDFGSGPVNVPFTGGVTAGDGGELRFDPTFFGLEEGEADTFALNYTVVDDSGASASNVITLNLTGDTPGAGNNPPNAQSVPSGVGAVPEEIIVDDPGTTSLTFNISGLVSDPDPGDTLTITVDNFNVGSDENGDPITVPFTFNQGTGDVTIQFADLNVADGTSVLGTLNYTVSDGTDTASGQVTYNFVNPAEPAPPQALTLDFEPFADPFGPQIDITDGTYLGFSFDGSAIVVETDEIGAGGRDTENGITRGQTTENGDNVLVGTFSTTEVQVGVDRNGDPVFETVPDEDFALIGPDASFGFNEGGQILNSGPSGFPPALPTNLPNDGVADPFDLDGLSLNVASGGSTTVTITTYTIGVVETPIDGSPGSSTYALDYVAVDTFEFTVDSETPATEIDFNATGFIDDLGNTNSAAFDDIAAITVTTDTGVAVVLDDVFVTV